MCKSLKVTNIHLVTKLTFLTGREKNMVVNTEVQNGSCVKYSILGDNT